MEKTFTQTQVAELLKDKSLDSISKILERLGVCKTSGTHYLSVKKMLEQLNADTSHLKGKSWAKGKISATIQDALVKDGVKIASSKLKLWLISAGLKKYQCEGCKLEEWMGRPIPIQLHHVNANNRDNRLENLQILCGNCHCQTPSYARRKNRLTLA